MKWGDPGSIPGFDSYLRLDMRPDVERHLTRLSSLHPGVNGRDLPQYARNLPKTERTMNSAVLVALALAALVVMSAQAAPTDLLEDIESEILELRDVLQKRQGCVDIASAYRCNRNKHKCGRRSHFMETECRKTCSYC
ncbi:hypothetical protein Bbelb_060930 [Branchiostoma belcheri]|nr:hypothetical protein Bbelb_060930 [Branchiostoma belcheri]